MSPAQVKLAIKNSGKKLSMDALFEEGESSNLYNVIKSKESNSPDTKMIKDSLRTDIEMVLKTLPSRESEIIRLNYGIGEQNPMSLSQIGKLFDITRERIRQISAKALRILQYKSRSEILRAYLY
ncbi:RNA polymerase sigma factor (sigma-70 family) [Arenibacter sp. ARW7G5Y1]|nr:RNA polymerase sigma factor (sigma-70 family) [Arenibacter sp. ARW7G5Y1]